MTRYRIRNWARFQHYKDRNPPWIKLHVEILASEDWVTLDDAGKLLALVCMVVAAKTDGELPDNSDYIKRVAYLDKRPNLTPLIECGFLENLQADDSKSKQIGASARPEKEADTEAEKERRILSADADPSKPVRVKQEKTYPEAFEEFWRDYPTDPIMSKKKAHEHWHRLTPADREAARAAIPAFLAHCKKNPTYRPIHAERFLSQRRFDGLNDASKPLAHREPHASWNGKQSALSAKIGEAQFDAYFAAAHFDPGPPTVIEVGSSFIKGQIERKFGSPLRALFGNVEIAVSRDVSA